MVQVSRQYYKIYLYLFIEYFFEYMQRHFFITDTNNWFKKEDRTYSVMQKTRLFSCNK